MNKKEIRKKFLGLRLSLTDAQYISGSQQMCNHFFSAVDLSSVKTVHTFLPIASKKEPDTWLIIDRLKKEYPQIKISIPKIENNAIISYYFQDRGQLRENSWRILEPSFGEITLPPTIDLVIVPLLAFDNKGNRVGYGKGFYDRFLKTCQPNCKKIGLSFFESVDALIPADEHDITLSAVITPLGKISFLSSC